MGIKESRFKLLLYCGVAVGLIGATLTIGIYFGSSGNDLPTTTVGHQPPTTSRAPITTSTTRATTTTSQTTSTTTLTTTPTTTSETPPKLFVHHGRPGLTGALVDYVYRQDSPPVYNWVIYKTEVQAQHGVTSYLVNLTSQTWMDDKFSNRPLWYHNLVIHIPDSIVHPSAGFLYITGGDNEPDREANLNNRDIRRAAEYAGETGIPSAVLRQTPNQPVIFMNEGVGRREDDIIAWTWRKYYNDTFTSTQNPDVLSRWPMIKGVARAMDAMTELAKEKAGISINNYMLSGASKRGWTTWMAGAVDKRVIAMIPMVLSCLNMEGNFAHYFRSFGAWPYAMYDYWNHGILERMDDPRMLEVIYYVDPYEYRHWMNIPKYIISGASDEFFLLDDYEYFYDALPGDNRMWIVDNSGHSAHSTGPHSEIVWDNMKLFYLGVLMNKTRPSFEFDREYNSTGGTMRVRTSETPKYISSFAAQSVAPLTGTTYRRDWRMSTLNSEGQIIDSGIIWIETQLTEVGVNNYEIYYENPELGYLAFYVKMVFDAGFDDREYTFSTKAQIIPTYFPFPDCIGQECRGILV